MWMQRRGYGNTDRVSKWHLFRRWSPEMRLESQCGIAAFGVTDRVVLCPKPQFNLCNMCVDLLPGYRDHTRILFDNDWAHKYLKVHRVKEEPVEFLIEYVVPPRKK